MFRFYKTILNLKTRLQEQNLKRTLTFFSLSFKLVHLLQNWIENKIHLLQNAFVLQNEFFYRANFFLTKLNFLKGDTNTYLKQIPLFEKKRFCKNHTYFFLENIIFFNLVLLHLNNHRKHRRTRGFSMFSGGIEKEQCREMA